MNKKSNNSKKGIQLEFNFDEQIESLRSTTNQIEITDINKILAMMACEEYQKWFTQGAECLKDKNLIIFRMKEISKKIWNWNIPPENEFAQYFKISRTKARSLLRDIKSKFGYECNEKLNKFSKEIINRAIPDKRKNPTRYTLYITNPLVEYRISEILSEIAKKEIEENRQDFRIMKKNRNFEFTYIILPEAYKKLKKYLQNPT